jgi:hypothetical protein
MSDLQKRPLFGCTNCCEDYSWPAEDLRVHGEELWCEACWDNCHYGDTSVPVYSDLPPFVPADTEQIAKLQTEVEVLREAHRTIANALDAYGVEWCRDASTEALAWAQHQRREQGE